MYQLYPSLYSSDNPIDPILPPMFGHLRRHDAIHLFSKETDDLRIIYLAKRYIYVYIYIYIYVYIYIYYVYIIIYIYTHVYAYVLCPFLCVCK